MAASQQRPKLIVIVGPTASGKSELAMTIARQHDGEIITADSRTIYKGMDIGTAKPTKLDRQQVAHWGLDLIEPGQPFSAKLFKDYAQKKVSEISKRGKLPIMAGGTGLYIDSFLFDFAFRPVNQPLHSRLEKLSTIELQQAVLAAGLEPPTNWQNRRHLIRTVEAAGQVAKRRDMPLPGALIVGLRPPDKELRRRINDRAERIFTSGVVAETRQLLDRYSPSAVAEGGIVYRICIQLLDNKLSQAEAMAKFKAADWQYARRQKTWFKRNPYIGWFRGPEAALGALNQVLNT